MLKDGPGAIPRGRLFGCPAELSLDLLGGKWKTIILARLKGERMRYGELRRAIPDLTDKVLTQRLREMEQGGFLIREDADGAITYRLSPLAQSLTPALQTLYDWGEVQGTLAGARFHTESAALGEILAPADQADRQPVPQDAG